MPPTSLSVITLCSLLAAPAAALSAQQPAAAPSTAETPTLVVFITVDQMRADYLTRFGAQLTGGLGRLVRGGAFFTNAHQDHAITETAPGHASTMSGRFPSHTGILHNSAGVGDPQSPLIDGGLGAGASPFRFRGGTLIDWMRMHDPRSRALSVSRKDRGAILPLGRAKQNVYWYGGNGRFTTSRYYADTLPSWLVRFNARELPERYIGQSWTLLLPDSAYPEPDSVAAEGGGRNFTFPHLLSADTARALRTIIEFPWMDDVTLQLALDGLNELALGSGPQTDLLAVSLSTTDAVGHRYGPDSREQHDQILRLDRELGKFLDSLFVLRDSTRVVVALTADHGVAPLPELYAARTHEPAWRVDPDTIEKRFRDTLTRRGVPPHALSLEDGLVLVDRAAFSRAGVDPEPILSEFAGALRRVPGVLRVDAAGSLARDSATSAIARRWCHMLSPDAPVAYVVTLRPHSVWGSGWEAMHGTPYDYDTNVPVIFFGPSFEPGKYGEFARVVDMAPTLAWVTGTPVAEPIDGRVLRSALRMRADAAH